MERSRRTNDETNPYFDSAEKTMISNGRRSALEIQNTGDAGVRSQMITKVKSLGLNSRSHSKKDRPLIISKKYHQSIDKEVEPKNYSYLKTKYFQ